MIKRNHPSPLPLCLPGFERINRYWDVHHNCWIAKILPGEFYVTRLPERIATTLGSCVSACLWDVVAGIGGMNHFMLPVTVQDSNKVRWGNLPSDATRYGNYAMEHLINEMLKHGAQRQRMRAKLFGGGRVMRQSYDVGSRNVDFVMEYVAQENLIVEAQDLRGDYPRKVLFDPISGRAFMKRLMSMHNDTISAREESYRKVLVAAPVEGAVELFD